MLWKDGKGFQWIGLVPTGVTHSPTMDILSSLMAHSVFFDRSADKILRRSPFPINLNITMQNTVTESNALALCANVYFNSTTKFVKGFGGTAPPNGIFSALLPEKEQGGQLSIHLSSLILKSSPPRTHATLVQSPKGIQPKSGVKEEMSQVEAAAISLSGNIYMNSTTKYVKGYQSPSPTQQPQKKSRSQGKKKVSPPSPAKKVIDPEATPSSVKKQRTPQKIAMEMAGSNYMTSTTRYVKNNPQGSSLLDPKAKVEKIVRNKPVASVRSNQKLERVISRDKPRRERESIGPKAEFSPTKSKSSSGSKVQRKKDKTRQLKFIQRTKPEESVVTVKDRASSIDFKTRRNDTKIIQQERNTNKPESSQVINENQYNIPQNHQSSIHVAGSNNPQPKPPVQRIQRNTINEAKSADTKKTQPKEESTTKPFSRHPQHARPQLLSRQNNEMIKSATSLPAADLPLQTPIKPKFQSSKIIPSSPPIHQNGNINKPIARSQQVIPISVIKEQRSSAIQNTKTTITNNKKSTHYSQHQEEPSTHKEDNNKNSEVSKLARNQSNRVIKKDEPVSTIHQGYTVNNNYSPRNNKVQERKDEPSANVVGNYNRPVPKRPQQPQPVQDSHAQSRKTTTPSVLQEKIPSRPQRPIEQKPLKTQPSDKGSKTSIQQSTIDLSKKKITPIVQNQGIRVLQSVSHPAKPQQNTNNVLKPEPIIQRQQSQRQNVKEITESKPQIVKRPSREQIVRHESSLKRSHVLFQAAHRLYCKTLSKALQMIVYQERSLQIHSKQASILAYQTINFFKNIQKSLKSSVFQQIKRLLPSKLIIKKEISANTNTEMAAGIIFRVLVSKYRQAFYILKIYTSFQAPVSLESSSKKSQGIDKQVNKGHIIQQFRKILQSFSKKYVQKAFNKILLEATSHQKKPISKEPPPQTIRSPQKYTKPPRNYQTQKTSLLEQKSSLQSAISTLQTSMSDKKRYLDNQKSKLSKKQSELIKKNKAAQTLVIEKRTTNKEMKKKLDSLGQQQDLDISLPEYEPLIGILTDIYSSVFGSKEETINTEALVQRYQLNKQDHNPLLQEWSSLLLNARLKQEISHWQGPNPFGACETRLRAQGEVLSKMTHSFIRERYLWEWVKTTAQKA